MECFLQQRFFPLSEDLTDNWTYPLIQPKLIQEARYRGYL